MCVVSCVVYYYHLQLHASMLSIFVDIQPSNNPLIGCGSFVTHVLKESRSFVRKFSKIALSHTLLTLSYWTIVYSFTAFHEIWNFEKAEIAAIKCFLVRSLASAEPFHWGGSPFNSVYSSIRFNVRSCSQYTAVITIIRNNDDLHCMRNGNSHILWKKLRGVDIFVASSCSM